MFSLPGNQFQLLIDNVLSALKKILNFIISSLLLLLAQVPRHFALIPIMSLELLSKWLSLIIGICISVLRALFDKELIQLSLCWRKLPVHLGAIPHNAKLLGDGYLNNMHTVPGLLLLPLNLILFILVCGGPMRMTIPYLIPISILERGVVVLLVFRSMRIGSLTCFIIWVCLWLILLLLILILVLLGDISVRQGA